MKHNINRWKDISWSIVEPTVFRLQLRIYKAAVNQDFEKMYKLQRLLLSSDFAKFIAVRKVTQDNAGKKTPGVDNKIVSSPKERWDLAHSLKVDGKSSPIRRTYIPKLDGSQRPLGIPTIEDRAKQMLAYLALSPQWEASFESGSYGFRPGRSVYDAMEAVFLGISRKPKWVLDADISKCFDRINHEYLLQKCNTFPQLKSQLRSWLKAGILDGEQYAFPEMGTPQGGVISPLLCNIALHGIRETMDEYIDSLGGHRPNNKKSLTYVRYADDFVVMYPNKTVLLALQKRIAQFLRPIGLELHPVKTKVVYTFHPKRRGSTGFTFLGFDVVHRPKRKGVPKATKKKSSDQEFILLITPSKDGIKRHKSKLRELIRSHRGVSQERLIQKLNPIIRGWSLSKRTQISSDTFQALDAYVYEHLWKWARWRHPKMPNTKLKDTYWHRIGNRNWIFGVKEGEDVKLRIQEHSKIPIQRHVKVKGTASPYDGNLVYWAQRTGKYPLLPAYKARLVKDQKGRCGIYGNIFLPGDIIERDHIVPKALGGANRRENVHAVHHYCHREKTGNEIAQIRRLKKVTIMGH